MGNTQLNIDSEFVVKEEKALNYVLAILFLALCLYGIIDTLGKKKFADIDYQSYIFLLFIIPAFFFFRRANSSRVYIRINRTGIYQDERLVTDWAGFLNAYISQNKKKFYSIQDHFVLVVEYRKAGTDIGLRRKIPLTNTQNRSEEDVLAAVRFFWQAGR